MMKMLGCTVCIGGVFAYSLVRSRSSNTTAHPPSRLWPCPSVQLQPCCSRLRAPLCVCRSSREAALKPCCAAGQKCEGHRYHLWTTLAHAGTHDGDGSRQWRGACSTRTNVWPRGAPLATGGYGKRLQEIEFFSCCVLVYGSHALLYIYFNAVWCIVNSGGGVALARDRRRVSEKTGAAPCAVRRARARAWPWGVWARRAGSVPRVRVAAPRVGVPYVWG